MLPQENEGSGIGQQVTELYKKEGNTPSPCPRGQVPTAGSWGRVECILSVLPGGGYTSKCCSASLDSCQLGYSEGPCLGLMERYFYNGTSMACETFNYGGCLGNGNNFVSEKECLQTCRTVGEHGLAPAYCPCTPHGPGHLASQPPAGQDRVCSWQTSGLES